MFDASSYWWKRRHAKKYETDIRDLIRSVTNNWDNYDEEYMKIKFNSDDYLPAKRKR